MDFYPWVVLTHVVSAFVFILAHGVSAFVAFRVRSEGDRARLTAVLDLSASSLPIMYAALLVALVSGIAAAIMGGHFEKLWPWAAIGVFLAVGIAMTPLGTFPLAAIRRGLGQPNRDDQKKGVVPEPVPDAELATLRAKVRPELLAAIGLSGLVAMIWLMEAKPF
ncbi:MAG: hypothetical protein ABIQ17_03205 [Candidatus Limnocylindrales bacterium]